MSGRGSSRPRLWIRLASHVSQRPPDSPTDITHRAGEWVEVRGHVHYPGEENRYGAPETAWSFWENRDIDLSPIFGERQVERVHVEPAHEHAERLSQSAGKSDAEGAPFTVTVAPGPPAEEPGG